MIQVGFYAVDLLAVVMTILTSVDTLSGEISSGTIQAIATKPISRWEILMGKWMGFAGMIAIYVSAMFGGVSAIGYFIAGVRPHNTERGALLVFLECLLLLTVTFACGTRFSTLANGVIVLGLHGLAFIGGWIEQIGALTTSPRLVTLGIVSSLIMPSESMWRRASFEMQSSLTRSIQFSPFSNASAPSPAMVGYAAVVSAYRVGRRALQFSRTRSLNFHRTNISAYPPRLDSAPLLAAVRLSKRAAMATSR